VLWEYSYNVLLELSLVLVVLTITLIVLLDERLPRMCRIIMPVPGGLIFVIKPITVGDLCRGIYNKEHCFGYINGFAGGGVLGSDGLFGWSERTSSRS